MNTRTAGTTLNFAAPRPAHQPEAWRDLDRALWHWVRAHGGASAIATAAAWASYADGQGHSALPLDQPLADDLPGLTATQRKALQDTPWVATDADAAAAGDQPFVLDGEHFYLRRNFVQETAVAHALAARCAHVPQPAQPLTDSDLRALFGNSWSDAEERQRAAVRAAPDNRCMVLTGGPGTGKTTTVLRMLLGAARDFHAHHGKTARIRVAAPTGKAAQRLGEALRTGAARLREGPPTLPESWQPHLDNVLAASSGTLHRLLGSRGRYGGFRHHARNVLAADIVVVDEASMLDLGLLHALLEALRDDATLILVGDADQLTSVGTGSVLMDVVAALEDNSGDHLVRLTHCFRADVTLVPINEAVRDGNADRFAEAWSRAAANGCASATSIADHAALYKSLARWASRLRTTLDEANISRAIDVSQPHALEHALGVLHRQQLLCANRTGPFGSVQCDAWLTQRLRGAQSLAAGSDPAWFPGRMLMITHNDATSGLFNGDVGICLRVASKQGMRLQVAFDPAPGSDADGPRLFDPNTLPAHTGAFALTVHKSQGSEYDHVAVLLPPDETSPLLTRQTLYTALSRARKSVELWSTKAATTRCLHTALTRHGRLTNRLRQR